jgi:protein-S-isoprenylcysteine O-methyltransferase Ste14
MIAEAASTIASAAGRFGPETAVNLLWAVWYASWVAAAAWSNRTRVRMRTDMGGLHRWLVGVGAVLLFIPAGFRPPGHGAAPVPALWTAPAAVRWALVALAAAGFGFCWWARVHLGRLWSGFVTLKEGHRIVDTGPYGLVRHPIYAGVMVSALATALLRATPTALLGFLLIAVGFAMTARIEERFLREQLGAEAYDAYSRRVPMLAPMPFGRRRARRANQDHGSP